MLSTVEWSGDMLMVPGDPYKGRAVGMRRGKEHEPSSHAVSLDHRG